MSIMTKMRPEFVTPLTFESISNNPVVTDMFSEVKHWDVEHIALARKADLMVIVPATANVIGKVGNGILRRHAYYCCYGYSCSGIVCTA